MNILENYNFITSSINSLDKNSILDKIKIIIVTKTISIDNILPLINVAHIHFGENKLQEAQSKWSMIKKEYPQIKLHLLGKLQSNKVNDAYQLFDFIHSLDSKKVALKVLDNEKKFKKNISLFVQVNIGKESQKGGIVIEDTKDFVDFCKKDLNLNVIGLMCIPPFNENPSEYFQNLKSLALKCNLSELSMGMSNDYIQAIKNGSTYVRIGSAVFGPRIN